MSANNNREEPMFTGVKVFLHLGRNWQVVRLNSNGSYFARDGRECDTGPYSTAEEAEQWVRDIRP